MESSNFTFLERFVPGMIEKLSIVRRNWMGGGINRKSHGSFPQEDGMEPRPKYAWRSITWKDCWKESEWEGERSRVIVLQNQGVQPPTLRGLQEVYSHLSYRLLPYDRNFFTTQSFSSTREQLQQLFSYRSSLLILIGGGRKEGELSLPLNPVIRLVCAHELLTVPPFLCLEELQVLDFPKTGAA